MRGNQEVLMKRESLYCLNLIVNWKKNMLSKKLRRKKKFRLRMIRLKKSNKSKSKKKL